MLQLNLIMFSFTGRKGINVFLGRYIGLRKMYKMKSAIEKLVVVTVRFWKEWEVLELRIQFEVLSLILKIILLHMK